MKKLTNTVQQRKTRQVWHGVRQALPIVLGYIPVGFAYGVLAQKNGLGMFNAVAMSLIVFAGSAQLIAAGLFGVAASPLTLIFPHFFRSQLDESDKLLSGHRSHLPADLLPLGRQSDKGRHSVQVVIALNCAVLIHVDGQHDPVRKGGLDRFLRKNLFFHPLAGLAPVGIELQQNRLIAAGRLGEDRFQSPRRC